MNNKVFLRKTCSVYASDIHLATMTFPFINKEIENGAVVKPILEKNISDSIKKIINNMGINEEAKDKISQVDWNQTNIYKIKNTLNNIERNFSKNTRIHFLVAGSNLFIEKVNKLIDLWVKINLDKMEKEDVIVNVINCYNFNENDKIDNIIQNHEYILKTTGIEEICDVEKLKKAN